MRTDIYVEPYLWSKDVDSLLRGLQRLEALRTGPNPDLAESQHRIDAALCIECSLLEVLLAEERNGFLVHKTS